jgi:molybdenum cofactor biosynthesis enzyme MoaA
VEIDRISIELTNACNKGCWFCYNSSGPGGATAWTLDELLGLITSCAAATVRAVSVGGGEPLQYGQWPQLFTNLRGVMFRSLTTNGLPLLDSACFDELLAAAPDKVHISIHFPERNEEVKRVISQVTALEAGGIRSGVNLLVSRSKLRACETTAARLRDSGISNERIVYLPMRMADTPSPAEVAQVAGGRPFQSMTCLGACGRSPRFCSVGWDKTVAWCSYTRSRRPLESLSYDGLTHALENLELEYCGYETVPKPVANN